MRNDDNLRVDGVPGNKVADDVRHTGLLQNVQTIPYQRSVVGEALYDLLSGNTLLYDSEGHITYVGEVIRALLKLDILPGTDKPAPQPSTITFTMRDSQGQDFPQAIGPVEQILRGGTLRPEDAVEVYARSSDGCDIPLYLYGAPLRDQIGKLTGAIIIAQEPGERSVQAREPVLLDDVEQAILQAGQSMQNNRGANPRSTIVNNQRSTTEPLQARQDSVFRTSEELEREPVEAISALFDPEWLDLNALIIDSMARLLPIVLHHELRWQLARALPLLWADRSRLTQVFFCLIDNAIRYAPPGSEIYITTASEGPVVHVSVRDQGAGSSVSELEHLLQSYSRGTLADLPRDRALEGGLPLVCTIIHMHGGHVWVESSPHKGFIFHFTLPVSGVA